MVAPLPPQSWPEDHPVFQLRRSASAVLGVTKFQKLFHTLELPSYLSADGLVQTTTDHYAVYVVQATVRQSGCTLPRRDAIDLCSGSPVAEFGKAQSAPSTNSWANIAWAAFRGSSICDVMSNRPTRTSTSTSTTNSASANVSIDTEVQT
eukprot:FR736502.1.p1 GENE.FR736502.1~~FR736502.1.p1  ORF type:complete len:150 (-),score=6.11 FR736502.1:119-568(-)